MTGITRDVCGIGHAMRGKNAECGRDSLASRGAGIRAERCDAALATYACMGSHGRHLGNAVADTMDATGSSAVIRSCARNAGSTRSEPPPTGGMTLFIQAAAIGPRTEALARRPL